jgi:hypothetical protein
LSTASTLKNRMALMRCSSAGVFGTGTPMWRRNVRTPRLLDPVAPRFATGLTQIGAETSAELRRVDYGSSSDRTQLVFTFCGSI